EIVKQYEQGWTRSVAEDDGETQHHGHQPDATGISLPDFDKSWLGRRGFAWSGEKIPRTGAEIPRQGAGHYGLWFPAWAPLALTMILPVTWLVSLVRRRRRISKHHCPNCGYDLRA